MEPYTERLDVPRSWWVVGVVTVVVVWVVAAVATPVLIANLAASIALALFVFGFLGYATRIRVDASGIRAGRAFLPVSAVGEVRAVEAGTAREVLGARADARAWLLVRPYVATGVVIEVVDPDDPAPYWFVASRRPRRLANTLRAARRAGA